LTFVGLFPSTSVVHGGTLTHCSRSCWIY